MFTVKFGTPKPILFRENWGKGEKKVDLDLEARFAGRCDVSEYDSSRYADEAAVERTIRENPAEPEFRQEFFRGRKRRRNHQRQNHHRAEANHQV